MSRLLDAVFDFHMRRHHLKMRETEQVDGIEIKWTPPAEADDLKLHLYALELDAGNGSERAKAILRGYRAGEFQFLNCEVRALVSSAWTRENNEKPREFSERERFIPWNPDDRLKALIEYRLLRTLSGGS